MRGDIGGSGGGDVSDFLFRRLDQDDAAIVQHQPVAVLQRQRPFQVEQEFAMGVAQHHPPPVALVESEFSDAPVRPPPRGPRCHAA